MESTVEEPGELWKFGVGWIKLKSTVEKPSKYWEFKVWWIRRKNTVDDKEPGEHWEFWFLRYKLVGNEHLEFSVSRIGLVLDNIVKDSNKNW